MDVVEFLRARLDEDERTAVALQEAYERDEVRPHARLINYGALVVPACVLREVEAKRLIVDLAWHHLGNEEYGWGMEEAKRQVLRIMATAYADHEDFQSEWR